MRSLLLDDCIQLGLDCEGGGAKYGNGQILTNGIIVVADSLAVLKYLVFEKNDIPMTQLLEALKFNWKGHEALRKYILSHTPRYGNHDDRADQIALDIANHFFSFLKHFKTFRGGHYTGLVVYFSRQQYYGNITGATPDGRFSGDVLEDSMGPWPGRDKNGPTAMMNSVARTVKETNPVLHEKYTGIPNKGIMKNLMDLDRSGGRIILRCPVIPGLNDREDHFRKIGELAEGMKNIQQIDVEPYHPLGVSKSVHIGKEPLYAVSVFPDNTEVEGWMKTIREYTQVTV